MSTTTKAKPKAKRATKSKAKKAPAKSKVEVEAPVPEPVIDRKAIHAYVSIEVHDEWHSFAAEHGVSVSALLEVLGVNFQAGVNRFTKADVTAARELDAVRRRRNRRSKV